MPRIAVLVIGAVIVIGTKVIAGIAAFMLLKATDWGEVTVVQAMDGLKYAFIIIISLTIGRYLPLTAGENEFTYSTVLQKVLSVAVIAIGFVILFT